MRVTVSPRVHAPNPHCWCSVMSQKREGVRVPLIISACIFLPCWSVFYQWESDVCFLGCILYWLCRVHGLLSCLSVCAITGNKQVVGSCLCLTSSTHFVWSVLDLQELWQLKNRLSWMILLGRSIQQSCLGADHIMGCGLQSSRM